jgi:lipid II:glycine glycyltransferase (peptidoglycan interpeptide bridge formation enzyme)
MVFAWGKTAAYFYGASSDEERQRMPTYAVQWAAIRWAKARGCQVYDMWGIPDAVEEELEASFTERTDGLWPVYRFKRGFGGEIKRTVGAADRVYNPLLGRLYRWRRGR